jgi:hypothetical protein
MKCNVNNAMGSKSSFLWASMLTSMTFPKAQEVKNGEQFLKMLRLGGMENSRNKVNNPGSRKTNVITFMK